MMCVEEREEEKEERQLEGREKGGKRGRKERSKLQRVHEGRKLKGMKEGQ